MKRRFVRHWWRLRHRVRRLGQIGVGDHALLAEAALGLAAARIAIRTAPFPRIARRLGGFMAPQHAAAKAESVPLTHRDLEVARKVSWAVTIAARHLPFEAVCLPQAMAAHDMLRKRGIFSVMHFGTAPGQALSLDAHAWLNAGEIEVTGYPVGPEYTEIACIA